MNYQKNLRKKHFIASIDNLFSVESMQVNFGFIITITLAAMYSIDGVINVLGVGIVALGILVLFLSAIKQKDLTGGSVSILGISFGIASSFYIILISAKLDISEDIQATGILLFSILADRRFNIKIISIAFCVAASILQLLVWEGLPNVLTTIENLSTIEFHDFLFFLLLGYYIVILAIIFYKNKKTGFSNMPRLRNFIMLNVIIVIFRICISEDSKIIILARSTLMLITYIMLFWVMAENKIKRPLEDLHNEVIDMSYALSLKNKSLQDTVDELEKQIISRVNYEKKLKYTEEKYQKIVDNSPEAIYIHQGDDIVFMNRAARNFFSIGPDETLKGISIFNMLDAEGSESMKKRLRTTQVEGRDCPSIELVCHCFDGSAKILEVTDISINLDGKNVTLSIGKDITMKRKLEEEEKRLAEAMEYEKIRSNFFSNISHELRTPVNLIYSCLQVMEKNRGEENSKCREDFYHTTMKQNCLRLTRTINNIIDVTTMDSGYYTTSYSTVEIVSLFEDITGAVAAYMVDKNKYIIFDTDIEEKEMVVDRDLLERMLLNLLSNAVKFSNKSDNIEVNLFNKENGIELRVRDYGIGIPEDRLDDIFDKFKQVDKSLRRAKEGSGLGLALVKSIVDIHRGSIKIQSVLNRGSTIIIYIPNKVADYNSNDNCNLNCKDSFDNSDIYNADINNLYMEAAACKSCKEEHIKDKSKVNCKCEKMDIGTMDKIILEFSDIYF
ncbi:PAS domain-containing sensor histidine kinase [Clostridium thermarum]|uniref:PAS domain-containing sensor histidine kinase n=1 Tax=Clostridium thermarum TaxID=1716543 RepID=UPI0013D1CF55|nr:PAS domain-containing sensor histidine kinase [Clostridium thermarum]